MTNGIGDRVSKGFTFWGMVGAVMIALKLKDRWDDYKQVGSEEDGLGPVALRSPVDESERQYHDNETDSINATLLDTEIPGAKPRRKRSRDCCVCCGLRCGLFWKAFGIVCLIVFVWQVIRLVVWAVTPSSTGLENMPAYSSSLGCMTAKHLFQGAENTVHTVALNPFKLDHAIDLRGAAVGTLIIAEGSPDSNEIKYQLTVRTDENSLLSEVGAHYPSNEEISEGTSDSRLQLTTPNVLGDNCMRYDIKLYVPPQLKKLHISAHTVTHVLFDADSSIDLDTLFVTLYTTNTNNMILPHQSIRAKQMTLEMIRGWLVGEVNIVDRAVISTQRGDAVANLRILPVPSSSEPPATASLQTTTGAGRTDLFWISDRGAPHRPISATHRSSRNGDLYLTYKEAEYNGKVDLKAKSYSATGLQGMSLNRTADAELPWVGDQNGSDKLLVSSPKGWVGLYF